MRIRFVLLALGCGPAGNGPNDVGPAPAVSPPPPVLRRLTGDQYRASVRALLGEDLALPATLEPDVQADGLLSVGAGIAAISALGVERYEAAALLLADQVASDPDRLAALLPCVPASASDAGCAERFVSEVGRRAWRRPLSPAEIGRLSGVVTGVGAAEGSFAEGVRYGLAAMLQSPHFLYRVELGVPEGKHRRLTGFEAASRLSFLLWASPPDDGLLDAAAAGLLDDPAGVWAVASGMLDDPRAEQGVRAFVDDWLGLYRLFDLDKDPTIFDHASPDLGPSAREETLRLFSDFALGDEDIRDVLVTRRTAVDPRLAALYRVRAPSAEGFAWTELPDDHTRRGLLGHASILGLASHATRSSATLRGRFVRSTLLCQGVPDPPANVDTSIPEPDATSPTLRDRIAVHLENPSCASCHLFLDPIGLGLENFDGIGRWRETEGGARIDASGDLDGETFDDAWTLASALRRHEDLLPCWADRLYAVGTGHAPTAAEAELVGWLSDALVASDHRWRALLLAFVASDGFLTVGEVP